MEFHSERVKVLQQYKKKKTSQAGDQYHSGKKRSERKQYPCLEKRTLCLTIHNSWLPHHVNNVNQQWFHVKIIYILHKHPKGSRIWKMFHKRPFHSRRICKKKNLRILIVSRVSTLKPHVATSHRHCGTILGWRSRNSTAAPPGRFFICPQLRH